MLLKIYLTCCQHLLPPCCVYCSHTGALDKPDPVSLIMNLKIDKNKSIHLPEYVDFLMVGLSQSAVRWYYEVCYLLVPQGASKGSWHP